MGRLLDESVAGQATVLEVAKPDCVADDFGGEIVVLNIASGMYYSLRELGAAVWRDLTAGVAAEQIVAELGRIDATLSSNTRHFINELQNAGLLRRSDGEGSGGTAKESIAAASSGNAALVMEGFEDMREFILTDPIHDADELLGWPAPRADGA